MKNNITELVFILDKSGSMAGLESDTIGGYNTVLQKQKKEEGTAFVTTVLFDDNYELLHDRINLRAVAPITEKEYFVQGTTALLDAMGKTITKIEKAQNNTARAYRADKVLFVITTDGMENASCEYTPQQIRSMVEKQKERGWEFLFLGANIDAIATAQDLGIAKDRATNYTPDSKGTRLSYEAVASAVSKMRANAPMAAEWKEEVEADYQERKTK